MNIKNVKKENDNNGYIYMMHNLMTKCSYVGQTSKKNPLSRIAQHFTRGLSSECSVKELFIPRKDIEEKLKDENFAIAFDNADTIIQMLKESDK